MHCFPFHSLPFNSFSCCPLLSLFILNYFFKHALIIFLLSSVSSAVPSPAQENPNASVEGLLSPCLPSKTLQVHDFTPRFGLTDISGRFSNDGYTPTAPLQRKCSIVREEDDACSTASGASSPAKSPSNDSKSLKEHLAKLEEDKNEISDQNVQLEENTESPRPSLILPVSNRTNLLPPVESKGTKLPQNSNHKSSNLNRRLHSVQSSPQLPVKEISDDKSNSERTPLRFAATRKKYVSKLQSRGSAISHVMLKMMDHKGEKTPRMCESVDPSNYSSSKNESLQTKGNSGSLPKNNESNYKSEQSKKASFAHSVFSTESTDSLDFLSEDQPRLMNSISCGDLSGDTGHFVTQDKLIVRSDSISLTEIPQLSSDEPPEEKTHHKSFIDSTLNRYTIGNSLSLNSGLSSLQRHKLNIKKSLHSSQPDKISEKNGRVSTLGRIVHSGSRSTNRQRLDINQNGWRKNERKREISGSGKSRGSQQAVVDMKLASKCCMLC